MPSCGTNVKYRGFMIDYHLRKERGMKRYSGKMIIYNEDLSFIVRLSLTYLPDNSITHVFNEADRIIREHSNQSSQYINKLIKT